jgi:hypothetical protein
VNAYLGLFKKRLCGVSFVVATFFVVLIRHSSFLFLLLFAFAFGLLVFASE